MKYGFSFNAIHSNSISGLVVKTVSRPITSAMRDSKFTVPLADGEYGTATKNLMGRAFYDTRIFTVSMQLAASNITSLYEKLTSISEWLTGPGILVFDDTAAVQWETLSVAPIDFAPERQGTKAVLAVSFEVQPYGSLAWNTTHGPMIGTGGVPLDTALPLDSEVYYSAVMQGGTLTMNVLNYGGRYVRPVVTVNVNNTSTDNSIGSISVIANGDHKMELYTAGKTMIADCKNHTLTDGDGCSIIGGSNSNQGFSGRFIELRPGGNVLEFERVNPASGGKLDISVDFAPQVMWGLNFGDIEWEW